MSTATMLASQRRQVFYSVKVQCQGWTTVGGKILQTERDTVPDNEISKRPFQQFIDGRPSGMDSANVQQKNVCDLSVVYLRGAPQTT